MAASAFIEPELTASTGISVTGAYPAFTITNTAPDQAVAITGTGITVSGTYPSFSLTNAAPDQTVSITGTGDIAVTGTYPNFTVDGTALQSAGVHEEMFVGVTESPLPIPSNVSQILSWSVPNNASESTSYHFGTGPAKLGLIAGGQGIENLSSQRLIIYADISAFVDVTSPNSDITYTMQRFQGGVWVDVKSVTRYKGSSGIQTDSFWSIFKLDAPEKLRVQISSTSGNVIFEPTSQIKFEVKEVGNII